MVAWGNINKRDSEQQGLTDWKLFLSGLAGQHHEHLKMHKIYCVLSKQKRTNALTSVYRMKAC